ncbi:MAG: hypothetical protein LBN33_09040 [Desulfovibrio sp.]|jgi:hypothetical protein|nr:hypothetical protein [Desulfovibrio sp.]
MGKRIAAVCCEKFLSRKFLSLFLLVCMLIVPACAGTLDTHNMAGEMGPPLVDDQGRPRLPDRGRIMAAARKYPREAVYVSQFYAVATPDEVREIIGGNALSGAKVIEDGWTGSNFSLAAGLGYMSGIGLFLGLAVDPLDAFASLHHGKTYVTELDIAAASTPYPEVIHILVESGGKVSYNDYSALGMSLGNPNAKVMGALLSYKADQKALDKALYRLCADKKLFTPEHCRLLLEAGADPKILQARVTS